MPCRAKTLGGYVEQLVAVQQEEAFKLGAAHGALGVAAGGAGWEEEVVVVGGYVNASYE